MKRQPTRIVTTFLLIAAIAVLAVFGTRHLMRQILRDTFRNRALPDMMALAAAVQHYQKLNGRLPSPAEFLALPPEPDFKVPFATSNPETNTSFKNSKQQAGEVADPMRRTFMYEVVGNTFLIRSLGPDGIQSDDDVTYSPSGPTP